MSSSMWLRRQIGKDFRKLRKRAGLTMQQVALKLDRGRTTIQRIEEGAPNVRFRMPDVEAMLELYGASSRETELLLAMTAETRSGTSTAWWHDYAATELPPWFELFVAMEDAAEAECQYEPELIPGLLQTAEYAEQVMRVPEGHIAEDEVKRRVQVRMERQRIWSQPRCPHLKFIINEAALHRPVGGTAVMSAQLQRLLEIGQQAAASIRVLPFEAGTHAALGAGGHAFTIFEFSVAEITGEPIEPPTVYIDHLTGAMYLSKRIEVDAYREVWRDLEGRAADEAASRKIIERAQRGYTGG